MADKSVTLTESTANFIGAYLEASGKEIARIDSMLGKSVLDEIQNLLAASFLAGAQWYADYRELKFSYKVAKEEADYYTEQIKLMRFASLVKLLKVKQDIP